MRIKYSPHLKRRIILRKIPPHLPEDIYESSKEHYYDQSTGHYVALKDTVYAGKKRMMIVSYEKEGEEIKLITIHPLKKNQKENRINSGRWTKK